MNQPRTVGEALETLRDCVINHPIFYEIEDEELKTMFAKRNARAIKRLVNAYFAERDAAAKPLTAANP